MSHDPPTKNRGPKYAIPKKDKNGNISGSKQTRNARSSREINKNSKNVAPNRNLPQKPNQQQQQQRTQQGSQQPQIAQYPHQTGHGAHPQYSQQHVRNRM